MLLLLVPKHSCSKSADLLPSPPTPPPPSSSIRAFARLELDERMWLELKLRIIPRVLLFMLRNERRMLRASVRALYFVCNEAANVPPSVGLSRRAISKLSSMDDEQLLRLSSELQGDNPT
mmetsp:Transcript_8207/g.21739  ORF Transcript_8207/g.21739 Transcript_8207/m.21739 type:complete len:120 (-) Transcript_8207:599-958(-)